MEKKIDIVLQPGALFPQYMTRGSAGADLYAYLREPITIPSGEWRAIPTGVSIALPEHLEAQIRPRSGLALRNGITVLNAPGTIDSDYRGEIVVVLINHGRDAYTVRPQDRIAQMVIAPVIQGEFQEVASLDSTERNENGFGHTGK